MLGRPSLHSRAFYFFSCDSFPPLFISLALLFLFFNILFDLNWATYFFSV